jgi:toxin ParE1/3/4
VTVRLVVRPAAEADILAAALWYQSRAPGLGGEFLRAIDVAFDEIERTPGRFPMIQMQCRRALVRRFPYGVYFVHAGDVVSVVACMHASRDPQRWQERAESDRP